MSAVVDAHLDERAAVPFPGPADAGDLADRRLEEAPDRVAIDAARRRRTSGAPRSAESAASEALTTTVAEPSTLR